MSDEDKAVGFLFGSTFLIISVVIVALLWANINWAPHAADLRAQEIKSASDEKIACINQGGLYADSQCHWSKN